MHPVPGLGWYLNPNPNPNPNPNSKTLTLTLTLSRCIHFQGDYLADLVELTDHPPLDVEGVKRLFFKWEEHKAEGIMTFRNHAHTRCSSREALTLTLTQNPSLNPNPEQPKP